MHNIATFKPRRLNMFAMCSRELILVEHLLFRTDFFEGSFFLTPMDGNSQLSWVGSFFSYTTDSNGFFRKDYVNKNRKQLVPVLVSFAKQGTETETTHGFGRPARLLEAKSCFRLYPKTHIRDFSLKLPRFLLHLKLPSNSQIFTTPETAFL